MATPTSLPATFTSGQILTATNMNDIRGAFRVLQVVQTTTTTGSQNNTSTYADTGLSASITPSATSSKVLVIVQHGGCGKLAGNTESSVLARLLRGATEIAVFETAAGYTGTSGINYIGSISTTYLDSPATTSSTTYKTQIRNNANANGCIVGVASAMSTMTLLEISA